MLAVLPLLPPMIYPAAPVQTETTGTPPQATIEALRDVLDPVETQAIEDITRPMIKAAQAKRLKAAQDSCRTQGGTFTKGECVLPPPPVYVPYVAPVVSVAPSGTLTGSAGYALPWGNCVNQIPYGLRGFGNPSSWLATTQTPYIGGAALWYFNHTGRIVGIWSNGDLEIAHENAGGWGQTRFPRSAFRGFR